MAYDEKLDRRIKKIVSDWKNTEDKKMFGGICHLLNGNMFCGVYKDFLILRLGPDEAEDALMLPHVRPEMTLVTATKGIETGSLMRMSEVIEARAAGLIRAP